VKILADQDIPQVAAAFRDLGEVELMPGREITRANLQDCRCLITRTVTRVDATLLQDTPVEFVGSATIGTDHIDLDYLADSNIGFSNAAGCNAEGAAEYVISGLFALSRRKGFDPLQLRAGIVGCGNVGSRLQQKLDTLGIECLVCDPPLQQAGQSSQAFVELDTILQECDLISLHVPLTDSGKHPTFHLLNAQRLQSLRDGCVLINAARGEVIDNHALTQLLARRDDLHVFLDTWENEPTLSRKLLRRVDLATPHIAGYSVEGRLRGTQMVLDAASEYFNLPSRWHMSQQLPSRQQLHCHASGSRLEFWQDLLQQHCNIWRDHDALMAGANLHDDEFVAHFDGLRKAYPDRLEYGRWNVRQDSDRWPGSALAALGFKVDT
jgi:erythronate-4-phosphate dehydrogenase